MLIKDNSKLPYIHCKRCGQTMRMGKSCSCGSVRTKVDNAGVVHIEETGDSAVIDSE